LSQVPGAVWQFVCGVPTDNEAVLPLLIGFAGITLLVGVALVAVHVWRRRSHTRTAEEG
jgi:hypothetical protein